MYRYMQFYVYLHSIFVFELLKYNTIQVSEYYMPVLVLVTKYIVHTNSRRWGYQGTKVSKLFADQINVKLNKLNKLESVKNINQIFKL